MLWELRYRARGVDDVWIEAETEDEARAVAMDWLQRTYPTPGVIFVRLRPAVVWSAKQMRAAAAEVEKAKEAEKPKKPAAAAVN